jgi:hypothetical protein
MNSVARANSGIETRFREDTRTCPQVVILPGTVVFWAGAAGSDARLRSIASDPEWYQFSDGGPQSLLSPHVARVFRESQNSRRLLRPEKWQKGSVPETAEQDFADMRPGPTIAHRPGVGDDLETEVTDERDEAIGSGRATLGGRSGRVAPGGRGLSKGAARYMAGLGPGKEHESFREYRAFKAEQEAKRKGG